MSEKHVLDNVKVVAKGKVLVDGGDPQILGILRTPEVDGLTVPEDLSLIGFPQARDRLYQAGLSCPVVADQSGHPARRYVEVHLGERLHGAEGLRHASQLHQRGAYAVEFSALLSHRDPSSSSARPSPQRGGAGYGLEYASNSMRSPEDGRPNASLME